MSYEQKREEIALLLRIAGLSAPAERIDRLVTGLEGTSAVVNIFAPVDFADVPPSGHFRPPLAR